MTEGTSRRLDAEDLRRVRKASMFASLIDDDFRLIAGDLWCETCGKGKTLFFQGELAKAFYLVLEGWILLSRDKSDGTRTVMKILGPGDSFAEALIVEGERYPVSAEAASFLRVARFDTGKFRNLVTTNPGLSLSMIAATFGQMRRLLEQIEHLKSWSVERRVAKMLLDLCGGAEQGACTFTLPIEQTLIAARLSISPPTLSRTLKKLGRFGVDASYGRIVIEDTRCLAAFVAESEEDALFHPT